MKKLLVTSACTLAISLCGTFSADQNGLDVQKLLHASDFTKEAQKVETSTDAQSTNQWDSNAGGSTTASNSGDSNVKSANTTGLMTVSAKAATNCGATKANTTKNAVPCNTATPSKAAGNKASVQKSDSKAAVSNISAKYQSVLKSCKVDTATSVPGKAKACNQTAVNAAEETCKTNACNQTAVNAAKEACKANACNQAQKETCNQNTKICGIKSIAQLKDYAQKQYNGKSVIMSQNCGKTGGVAQEKSSCKTDATAKTTQGTTASVPDKASTTVTNNSQTAKASAPAPSTQTPATESSSSNTSNFANQVLNLVNQERAKQGLSALSTTSVLSQAANKRAQETSRSFSHTRPDGTSFSTVLAEYNITYMAAGENIAYGQKTPQEVVTGWMNSPGHRANILNSKFNKIGIGVYQASNGTIYWSQLFTN